MNFGTRDRRITFQAYSTSIGTEGSPVKTWVDTSTQWANFRQESGGETLEHGRVNAVVNAVFNIRHSASFTPDRTMRVVYNSTNLNIIDVRELPGRRRAWDIVTRADAE
jgi:SPP1 family predicted phage head-tail adaptor